MSCTCGRLAVGMHVTAARNWNPDCAEHGLDSEWWNHPTQREERRQADHRLRQLQDEERTKRQRRMENERKNPAVERIE